MEKRPNPVRARKWLFMLGILGAIIVCLSIPVYHVDSGISIVGYVIGFVCLLLAGTAMFTKNEKK
ncbi:hypothetical protein [Alicyclobacillus dauci]|uniref:Uncharacterized protein n=1 Tax=Alicyclobacillus dauci TaxID=1475485 RepID=A0ABY6Z779_9BACL|nr:hypothetical protein [Alicyclobacillus dauci]WAH37865.1 hypothetical protein NZD86_05015 [Alicyclobacillus dauci]